MMDTVQRACQPTQLKALLKDKEYIALLESQSLSFLECFVPFVFSYNWLFSRKRVIRLLINCLYYST